MENNRLISFDLKANFGFFKKPDVNETYLTYNMLHKPALLGILGAIAGLKGHEQNGKLPDYYKSLNHLKIGISPLESSNGNFQKCFIGYNNGTGFANKMDKEEGCNLQVTEQTLIRPAYRCYLLLDDIAIDSLLYKRLKECRAEFLPYMGKNDFSAWWENFTEYDSFSRFDFDCDCKVVSIFMKSEGKMSDFKVPAKGGRGNWGNAHPVYLYFEKLPVSFDERLFQYEYRDFIYAPAMLFRGRLEGDCYCIGGNQVVQLF